MGLPETNEEILLLHNPRCSKSRATEALLTRGNRRLRWTVLNLALWWSTYVRSPSGLDPGLAARAA